MAVLSSSTESPTFHFRRLKFLSLCIFTLSLLKNPPGAHGKLTIEKECGDIVCESHYYCSKMDHSCRPCQLTCDPALGNFDKSVCERDCQDYLHDLWYIRKSNETDEVYVDLYYKIQEDLRLLKILIGIVIILSTVVMLAMFAIMIYFKRMRNQIKANQTGPATGGDSSSANAYLKKMQKKKDLMDLPVIYSNNRILSLPLQHDFTIKGPASHKSGSLNNNLSRGSTPDLVSRSVPSHMNSTDHEKNGGGSYSRTETNDTKSMMRFRREPSESTLPEYAFDNPALVPSPTHM